ncbi:MAG: FtsX-like permease family protein, partial [Clostridia bacterium]|nr:FtsX-like permease family protein [Clostridia bacterium]
KVNYTDVSELLVGMLGDLIDISTYTLIAFSSVSLIVSSIMIAIITYASVIERIKEIGTIRSLGGRKKDVANMFRTEACIIGGVSALIALIATLIINGVINIVLGNLVGVTTIAKLSFGTAFGMTALSVGLNLIASLIPANIAAKKDPVLALRSE